MADHGEIGITLPGASKVGSALVTGIILDANSDPAEYIVTMLKIPTVAPYAYVIFGTRLGNKNTGRYVFPSPRVGFPQYAEYLIVCANPLTNGTINALVLDKVAP